MGSSDGGDGGGPITTRGYGRALVVVLAALVVSSVVVAGVAASGLADTTVASAGGDDDPPTTRGSGPAVDAAAVGSDGAARPGGAPGVTPQTGSGSEPGSGSTDAVSTRDAAGSAVEAAQFDAFPDGGLGLPRGTRANSVCGLAVEYGSTATVEATGGFVAGLPYVVGGPEALALVFAATLLNFANLGDGLTDLTLSCDILPSPARPTGGQFSFALNEYGDRVAFCAVAGTDPTDGDAPAGGPDQSSVVCTEGRFDGEQWQFTNAGAVLGVAASVLNGESVTVQFYPEGLPVTVTPAPEPDPSDVTVSLLVTNGELTVWDGLPVDPAGEADFEEPGYHVVIVSEAGTTDLTATRVVDGEATTTVPVEGRVLPADATAVPEFVLVTADTGGTVQGVDERGIPFDGTFDVPSRPEPTVDYLPLVCGQFSTPFRDDLIVETVPEAARADLGLPADADADAVALSFGRMPTAAAPLAWSVGGCSVDTYTGPLAGLVASTPDGGPPALDLREETTQADLGLSDPYYYAAAYTEDTDRRTAQAIFDEDFEEIDAPLVPDELVASVLREFALDFGPEIHVTVIAADGPDPDAVDEDEPFEFDPVDFYRSAQVSVRFDPDSPVAVDGLVTELRAARGEDSASSEFRIRRRMLDLDGPTDPGSSWVVSSFVDDGDGEGPSGTVTVDQTGAVRVLERGDTSQEADFLEYDFIDAEFDDRPESVPDGFRCRAVVVPGSGFGPGESVQLALELVVVPTEGPAAPTNSVDAVITPCSDDDDGAATAILTEMEAKLVL
jgi:hypothetical protein